MGPLKQLKRMFEPTRLIATIVMLVRLFTVSWPASSSFLLTLVLKLFFQQLCLVLTLCAVFWVSRNCRIWNNVCPFFKVGVGRMVLFFSFSVGQKIPGYHILYFTVFGYDLVSDCSSSSWHLTDCPYRILSGAGLACLYCPQVNCATEALSWLMDISTR